MTMRNGGFDRVTIMPGERRPARDLRDFVGIAAGLVAVGGAVFTVLSKLGVSNGYALSGGMTGALLVICAGLLYLLLSGDRTGI